LNATPDKIVKGAGAYGARLGRQWRISATAVRKLIETGGQPKPTASEDSPAPDKKARD
jgi:hypothetical protein